MRSAVVRSFIIPVITPLLAAACASATASEPRSQGRPSAGPSAAELEAIYRARTDSARMRFTAADVEFINGMIHHHAQAIVMGRMAPTHTSDASIQTLAARIISAQRDEIARMQQWLRVRDQPVPEVHTSESGVMVHGAGHAMHMPGMLTDDQIRQLDAARGTAFDRLFLTFMIQHHRGAVTMVHELFATDGAAQDEEVFKLASDVQVDQATEIARMELMLSALPDDNGSPRGSDTSHQQRKSP